VSHLKSTRENSIRAAERIIEFTQKALELEKRIEALEARLMQQPRTGR